jgi:hypothetical protein
MTLILRWVLEPHEPRGQRVLHLDPSRDFSKCAAPDYRAQEFALSFVADNRQRIYHVATFDNANEITDSIDLVSDHVRELKT